jgi:hypothetical protein
MKRKFCCDASRAMYEDYYLRQSGNGLPVFQGSRGQRGHGLGSMLSGLFRSAVPMIKRGLATFGKHALKTGLEIAGDVTEGKSFKDSARERIVPTILPGIKRFVDEEILSNQSGSGKRRRILPRIEKKSRKHKISRKRVKQDIFP